MASYKLKAQYAHVDFLTHENKKYFRNELEANSDKFIGWGYGHYFDIPAEQVQRVIQTPASEVGIPEMKYTRSQLNRFGKPKVVKILVEEMNLKASDIKNNLKTTLVEFALTIPK